MNSIAKTKETQKPRKIGSVLWATVVVLVAAPFLAYALLSSRAQGTARENTH